MNEITREEWKRRYAARIVERAGMTKGDADDVAEVGAESYEYMEQERSGAVVWHGDANHFESPENLADCEMSYWDDDEG